MTTIFLCDNIKIIEEEIMKIQNKIKKFFSKLCKATIIIGIVAGTTYGAVKIINSSSSSILPDTPEVKNAKEKEKALKEDLKKDIPDKNPSDIIIPDDASEEKKQQLQDEKDYWQIVKDVKDTVKNDINESYRNKEGVPTKVSNFESIRNIRNIYQKEGKLIIDCTYLYMEEYGSQNILTEQSALISISSNNVELDASNLNSIIDFINSDTTTSIEWARIPIKNYDGLNEFYQNHIKNSYYNKSYEKKGYSAELIRIESIPNNNGGFSSYYCMQRFSNGEEVFYTWVRLYDRSTNGSLTFDEWKKVAIDENAQTNLICKEETIYKPLGIDWTQLAKLFNSTQEQKKSGAEAAAFEGMKEIGQNGELIGFDYNKYREFQDEKDAKEQQAQQNKIVEESKLLFPDFDLSL